MSIEKQIDTVHKLGKALKSNNTLSYNYKFDIRWFPQHLDYVNAYTSASCYHNSIIELLIETLNFTLPELQIEK